MRGKVIYPGHALHGKTVELDGTELAGRGSPPLIECYRIPMPEGHVILLPTERVRVLAEVSA